MKNSEKYDTIKFKKKDKVVKKNYLQVSISAPANFPACPKWIRMNFPNREELSLRVVLAFPKASRTGFVCTI